MAGVTTISTMNGTPAIGGWTIIQTGSKHITRNGPRTAIGTTNIIGTIGAGGKNTTQIGRANIITIGSKDLDAGSLHSQASGGVQTRSAQPRGLTALSPGLVTLVAWTTRDQEKMK